MGGMHDKVCEQVRRERGEYVRGKGVKREEGRGGGASRGALLGVALEAAQRCRRRVLGHLGDDKVEAGALGRRCARRGAVRRARGAAVQGARLRLEDAQDRLLEDVAPDGLQGEEDMSGRGARGREREGEGAPWRGSHRRRAP